MTIEGIPTFIALAMRTQRVSSLWLSDCLCRYEKLEKDIAGRDIWDSGVEYVACLGKIGKLAELSEQGVAYGRHYFNWLRVRKHWLKRREVSEASEQHVETSSLDWLSFRLDRELIPNPMEGGNGPEDIYRSVRSEG